MKAAVKHLETASPQDQFSSYNQASFQSFLQEFFNNYIVSAGNNHFRERLLAKLDAL